MTIFYLDLCFIVNLMPYPQRMHSFPGLCFMLTSIFCVFFYYRAYLYIVCTLSVMLPDMAIEMLINNLHSQLGIISGKSGPALAGTE